MHRLRELSLNSLLAVLVGLSIILTAQVWYPTAHVGPPRAKQPSVESQPPAEEGRMPDVYRPERIYVRRKNGTQALLPAGSDAYRSMWEASKSLITGVKINAGPNLVDEAPKLDGPTVTLILPIALTLSEWAGPEPEHWNWNTVGGLRNPSMKIDRVTFDLGQTPAVYLNGSSGNYFKLKPITPAEQKALEQVMADLEPGFFLKARPVAVKEGGPRLAPGMLVPDIAVMQEAKIVARKPNGNAEKARFFPDLTVVRQITEKDALSFTDGQRLLRVTNEGSLEYRAAAQDGKAPDLVRSLHAAKEWMDARSGWSRDLVLGWYVQQPYRTTLVFEYRGNGPFPVESAGGAVQVDVTGETNGELITQFKRYPEFESPLLGAPRAIIPPEIALQTAADIWPHLFLFDAVREIHPAYLLGPIERNGVTDWNLEPVWVLQVGEERIYVPAFRDAETRPMLARP